MLEASHHPRLSLHEYNQQTINLNHLPVEGWILDIGGGGEGVIGQLMGNKVIAIDRSRRELEEAPAGGLKIVMDATDLQFLDGTFSAVTVFYCLMYIPHESHAAVLRQAYRVLMPGGSLYLWDVNISEIVDKSKDGFAVPLKIRLPDREILTGYGARWPRESHDLNYYSNLCKQVGFEIITGEHNGLNLSLIARKGTPRD